MLRKALRLVVVAFLGAIGVWWGRLVAHSKTPAPEGRWREIPRDRLE